MAAPIPCEIRGIRYPSFGAAAKALGCTASAIWLAAEEGRLDGVATGRKPSLYKACRINGQKFPSYTIAANALGVSRQTISSLVRNGSSQLIRRYRQTRCDGEMALDDGELVCSVCGELA